MSSFFYQILRGAGHHVYADNSEEFNSFVLKVSESADQKSILSNMTSDFQTKEVPTKEQTLVTTCEIIQTDETVMTSANPSTWW